MLSITTLNPKENKQIDINHSHPCDKMSLLFRKMTTGTTAVLLLALLASMAQGFLPAATTTRSSRPSIYPLASTTSSSSTDISKVQASVIDLKKVLEREYISFFDPMERDWYAPSVSFEDPMTALAGVDAYQTNVDMLASRTLMGKFLFADAGIVLHSVTGGDVQQSAQGKVQISNIITRWTLRVTAKVLPWSPTARFSGISVYDVVVGGPKGVMVEHQTDYWDSINIQNGKADSSSDAQYQKVDTKIAINDFLSQLKPENAIAPSAGPELPYQLLRRGNGYEVRRYPSYVAVKIPYERRDEAFSNLGSFAQGML